MTSKKRWMLAGGALVIAAALAIIMFPKSEFILGGAMINLGYRLQDRLAHYDFIHDESISPDEIWEELKRQNDLAAGVREVFPRTARHPVVAVVACMDGRIDTNELVGDTRGYYYVVRTAGSVLAPAEQEMLELAVLNGVRLVLLTTHTDCAAEAAAADPELEKKFPAMTSLVDVRERSIEEFLARPFIRDSIAAGKLTVKRARIDTATERLMTEEADQAQ